MDEGEGKEQPRENTGDQKSSFQNLFSTASKQTPGTTVDSDRKGLSENLPTRFALTDEAPPELPALHPSDSIEQDEEEEAAKRNALINFFRPKQALDHEQENNNEQTMEEEVVDDVYGLAMSFCRDMSVEELREEWFKEDGLKDKARLDFKRRRKHALKSRGAV